MTRQIELGKQKQHGGAESRRFSGNLTISRSANVNTDELIHIIAQRTAWKVYDKEIVDYIAHHAHVRKALVESFDEKQKKQLDEMFSFLLNAHHFSHETYLKYLIRSIISIAAHGKAVFVGRGANFILNDDQALKVRIIKERLQNPSDDKENIERAAFVKRMFNADINDAGHYHMVLNLSKMEVQTCADVIIHALEQKYDVSFTEKTVTS